MQTGHVVAVGAQAPDDAHPVEVGHRDVEDDHRGRPFGDRGQRCLAAVGGGHREALEAQCALEGLANRGLVVDDEDERLSGDGAPPRPAYG